MSLESPFVRQSDIDAPVDGIVDFLSSASFWTPIRAGAQSGWVEHASFAFWLVEACRPKCFVELGTHTGYSFSAVCQAVQALGTGTRCYAVDTWQGDDHAGFYGDDVFQDLSAFTDKHFPEFATLIRSTFSEALSQFADGSIDLLHIDGRHAYEDVAADYHEWVGKLTPDAIVLFHDTTVLDRGFGVAQFWAEVARDRPHFEFLHGNGLGVLGSHTVSAPKMRALFDSSGEPRLQEAIRGAYSRLGFSLKAMYQDLRPDRDALVAELTRDRAAFADGCAERDATIVELNRQMADLARDRAAFADGCRERDARIMDLNQQLADVTRERAAFEGGCADRDMMIVDLSAQVTHSKATLAGALELIEAMRRQRRTG